MEAVDFFTRQRINRRKSVLLIAGFLAFFVLLGLGVDWFWIGAPWPIATVVALVVAWLTTLFGYYGGARAVVASVGAIPLNHSDPEQAQVFNIVREMSIAAGLPCPDVMLIPDSVPNALATGRDPAHAVIAVTQGLIQMLDREETQGVVAHEMAHIGNRDTLTMTLVTVLFGGAVMLSDWARHSINVGDKRRPNVLAFGLVLVLIVATPILARLLAMAVSRQREYLADATAAQLTRNPLGLARALEKISGVSVRPRFAMRGTAHMFIVLPFTRRVDTRQGPWADLMSSHPPVAQRIAILRAMARGGMT